MRRLGNRGRGEFKAEVADFEAVERLAIAGELEAARDETKNRGLSLIALQAYIVEAPCVTHRTDCGS
jgi:hypothetical protein